MARSEQPTAALDSMAEVLKPGGIISLPGVYTASVVGARDSLEKEGRTPLQLGKIWQKGATIAMGAVRSKHSLAVHLLTRVFRYPC